MAEQQVFGRDVQSTPQSQYGVIRFIVEQLISKMTTNGLVKVLEFLPSDDPLVAGRVVVQPMVAQVDGNGGVVPHGPIYDVAYFTLQGGVSAVLLEPAPGDIGLAAYCREDISVVKQTRKPGPPGSARLFDWANGIYFGGIGGLNAAPTQYVRMTTDDGVQIISPTKIKLQAPAIEIVGPIEQSGGNVHVAQSLTADVQVTAGNIGLTTHKHPTAGTGPPSAPIP